MECLNTKFISTNHLIMIGKSNEAERLIKWHFLDALIDLALQCLFTRSSIIINKLFK